MMEVNLTGEGLEEAHKNKDDEKKEEFRIMNEKDDKNGKRTDISLLIGLLIIIIIAILVIILFYLYSGKLDNNKDNIDKKMEQSSKIRLRNWEFISSENISLTPEQISKGDHPELFNKAPEDVYVCTAMGGLSGHTNKYFYEQELRKVNKTQFDVDWYFRTNFELNISNSEDKLIIMHINGINYKSDVYLDGKLVSNKANIIGTFIKYSLDITEILDKTIKKHYIAFKVSRPHNQWNVSNKDETDLAISFVDWNPEAPDSNMGIWQPVDIEIFKKKQLTVSSAFIRTEIIEEKKINLEIVLHIKNWEGRRVENTFSVQLGNFIYFYVKDVVFESFEEKQIILDSDTYGDLSIKYDPDKLWWPFQMGKQTMHTLTLKFKDYMFTKELGLKQVESEYDSVKKISTYKINNKKILLKGAGWTPDLFLRQSPENYYTHIKYVRDMGLNVIRLEGKSEGEEFYEYCDKMGILIISGWNCADAWQRWKYWDDSVIELSDLSVRSQIRKLSPHPSVIIFILGSDDYPKNGTDERWRQIFFEERWPNEILSSAAVFAPKEFPTGVKMSGPYSWVPPNYFFLKKSRSNKYGGAFGFLTEGGPGENPLRRGSIEKVFSSENLEKYNEDSWNYHCGNKNIFGNLTNLTKPIENRMGNIKNFDDFMRKSSAMVYEGHRAMFEAYECYRYESTGVIQWMLNNAWPSNIWHLYDYFFAPTPSYFATKKSTEQIHALYNYEDNGIYLNNNNFSDFNSNINLEIYVIKSNGKNVAVETKYIIGKLKSDEIKKVAELKEEYGDNYIVHLEYSYKMNEKDVALSNTYFLNKKMDEMNYTDVSFFNIGILSYANMEFLESLENTTLTTVVLSKSEFEENGQKKFRYNFKITNNGDTIALLLEMQLYELSGNEKEMVVPIIWTDNYFSIRGQKSYETTAEFVYDKNKDLYLNIIGWNCDLNQKLN